MTRYLCLLSSELLEKSIVELNEPRDNNERLETIDNLRNGFDTDQYGPLLRDDDVFMLRFLRAQKFNHLNALKVLHQYHAVRRDIEKVFEKVRNPTTLLPVLKQGFLSVLPGTSFDGATMILYRPGVLKEIILYEVVACGMVLLENLLEDERNQICGIGIIEDMENLSIKPYLQVSPFDIGRLLSVWHDAMPLRVKSIHLVNEGRIFDILFALLKPFLKPKMKERVCNHGDKYSNMHAFIDPAYLPPYLGGTGPDADVLADVWIEKLSKDWPQDTSL